MEIRVAGHRLYGYKWCCQNKIIIVLIRKLFGIGSTVPLKKPSALDVLCVS